MRCVDVKALEKLFRKKCNMSLVAYGISDDSSSDEEAENDGAGKLIDVVNGDEAAEPTGKVNSPPDSDSVTSDEDDGGGNEGESGGADKGARTLMRLPKPNGEVAETEDVDDEDDKAALGSGLFSSLPAPKVTSSLSLEVEMDDPLPVASRLAKKETVKITVPSLSEFKEDESEEPKKKKLKPSSVGSGLFALLPAPKNMTVKETKRALVPNVLTKKPAAFTVNPAPSLTRRAGSVKPSPALTGYEDSGDEAEAGDYFSLGSAADGAPGPGVGGDEGSLPVPPEATDAPPPTAVASGPDGEWPEASPQGSAESESNPLDREDDDLLLNEEAMQRLCGRRAARDRAGVQLIEVSGDALMPDPKEWLTKQLTEERQVRSHGHRRDDGPTSQQKRKHQITYLAFQAKENELELKNQWSQNRMTRKQTQSKYGF
ncbi:proline-rich protein PRCC [Bacillus rossius redtenbacheri]|uniref:proline-rich protein PRCC n=1 Tax=Bacillus rossius redtenbacheri TaxID=93214 RepID=UPI002FDCC01B